MDAMKPHKMSHSDARGGASLDAAALDQPAARWTPALIHVLEEQQGLCARLEHLSRSQSSHVQDGRTEDLIGVLSERQGVIERIVELNGMLEPFRARRMGLMSRMSAVEREAVQTRIDAIAESIERVRRQDDTDRASLERQRTGVAEEISGLSRVRGALAAYGAPGGGASRHAGAAMQDRQG